MGRGRAKKLQKESQTIEIIDDAYNPLEKMRIDIKCKNPRQKKFLESMKNNTITFVDAVAGVGKSYLACGYGLKELGLGNYEKLVLVKSVTTLEEESVGFLKGTIIEKLTPVMYSFTGNIEKIVGKKVSNDLLESGKIEWMPIAYLRGVSIDNSIIIIDEAQNISIKNIRTILSRIGEGSKMIILGDSKQKDVKGNRTTALEFVIQHFSDIVGIGAVTFLKEDIVRNPIIQLFENKFDELQESGLMDGLI